MDDLSKNFSRAEFECSCGCGSNMISQHLIELLQHVRNEYGPLEISSGVRCASYNRDIGGVDGSAHVPHMLDEEGIVGHAADILCLTSEDRYMLLPLLMKKFKRIGIGKAFIHVDIDVIKVQGLVWEYS